MEKFFSHLLSEKYFRIPKDEISSHYFYDMRPEK